LGTPSLRAVTGPTGTDVWSATPYLGIGFTGTSMRRGWGFSADLGVTARGTTAGLRVGSGPTLDDLLRELRLTPLLHMGVSYAF
jgi:hypothetical protein